MDIKKCRVCGIELIPNINWKLFKDNNIHYICISCNSKFHREYYLKNKDKMLAQGRDRYDKIKGYLSDWRKVKYQEDKTSPEFVLKKKIEARKRHRKGVINTYKEDGTRIQIRTIKREYTNECEICHKHMDKWLNYHHWDDNNPSKGLWLCPNCHVTADQLEKISDFKEIYTRLKQMVEDNDNGY